MLGSIFNVSFYSSFEKRVEAGVGMGGHGIVQRKFYIIFERKEIIFTLIL